MNAFDDRTVDEKSAAYEELLGVDMWRTWTATRTGWTDTGAPTVTARYKFVGKIVFFQIKVVPATNTATTAGTSYTSLPVAAQGIGGMATMTNLTTNIAVGVCHIDQANSRMYTPTQSATGNTIVMSGWYERG